MLLAHPQRPRMGTHRKKLVHRSAPRMLAAASGGSYSSGHVQAPLGHVANIAVVVKGIFYPC